MKSLLSFSVICVVASVALTSCGIGSSDAPDTNANAKTEIPSSSIPDVSPTPAVAEPGQITSVSESAQNPPK